MRLRHGTTRQRALAILRNGPDPKFIEPGGGQPAGGFSVTPVAGPFPLGTSEQYAAGKANLFPNEGGPVVIEIEVPESVVRKAINAGGEIRFEPGFGLEELLAAWPTIPKKAVLP